MPGLIFFTVRNIVFLISVPDFLKGFVISEISPITDTVIFTNGKEISAGEAVGDVNELSLRRIQIREAIRAHFEKEQVLFHKNIKVLTLFFIDEVAKYRFYTKDGDEGGEYAKIFEEEYTDAVNELGLLLTPYYQKYLEGISAANTHNGYFSIDKKSNRFVDPSTSKRSSETDDVDAYDLILKDKERLLSLEEPTRFISGGLQWTKLYFNRLLERINVTHTFRCAGAVEMAN